jgi:hypothetical protein
MSDSRTVSGSVTVEHDSVESVALKLTRLIGSYESDQSQDRRYWLTLYHQCYKAARGRSLEEVLRQS